MRLVFALEIVKLCTLKTAGKLRRWQTISSHFSNSYLDRLKIIEVGRMRLQYTNHQTQILGYTVRLSSTLWEWRKKYPCLKTEHYDSRYDKVISK